MNKHHCLAATLTLTVLSVASHSLFARAIHPGASSAPAPAVASPVIVQAMEAELARAMGSLGSAPAPDAPPKPYFLSYEVADATSMDISAQYGAITGSNQSHRRTADVEVRLGSPAQDNTHGDHRNSALTTMALPLTDDRAALARSLWYATDRGYAKALDSFLKVKTEQQVRAKEEDSSSDFSAEKPAQALLPPPPALMVDRAAWEQRLREISALFKQYPDIFYNNVNMQASTETDYFVSSDGSRIATPSHVARLVIVGRTRAADGMDLFRVETFEADAAGNLPDQQTLLTKTVAMAKNLEELRNAPITEPYNGPAILSGRASAVFFHEVLGHRLEGQRQRGDEEGQTFTKLLGKPILPDFLSVADDPTLTTFNGTPLSGHYSFDDEGQPARRVDLIKDGVLETFLMSRQPIASFSTSNGHGRSETGHMPTGRQGNLIVTSSKSVSDAELRAMLIAEAKKQNKPYGLYFEDISSGFAVTTRRSPQAFQVIPLVVYRVFVDGRPDELVRGVSIVGTPQAALNRIVATNNKQDIFNGICGAESGSIPVSAVAPAMLVSEIETQRQSQGDGTAADYPAAVAFDREGSQLMNKLLKRLQIKQAFAGVLFPLSLFVTGAVTHYAHAQDPDPMLEAMKTELSRERSLLFLPGMQKPYFIEYRMDELSSYDAVANYGALTREENVHQRIVRVSVRIGDYAADSSSSRGDGNVQLAPEDNDPAALRYALWTATDEAYKTALRAYAAKQANLKRFQSAATSDDFSPAKAVTVIKPLVALDLDREEWKHRIVEASGLYATDPAVSKSAGTIQYSTASVRGIAVNRYLVNTEGTVVRHGYTGYAANISVGGQAADGMKLGRDNGTTAALAKDLEPAAAFHKRAVEDLKSYQALRAAPIVDADDYHGAVLFSGDAAADALGRLFVPNIEADRPDAGTTARTQGSYTSSLRARVLPNFMSVKDDPLLTTFEGKHLMGSYEVDDEGVPAQSIDVVLSGKLLNYDIGREPVKDFPESNGHGRAGLGQPAHSRAGVIVVKSSEPLTADAMKARLNELAKKQGSDAYEVETLGGELVPRLLYRIHADGTRELVRGAAFDELDLRSLRSDIVAAGDHPYIANTIAPIPQTTIAPSLLFGDIAVKRATDEQQKLPYYAAPPQ